MYKPSSVSSTSADHSGGTARRQPPLASPSAWSCVSAQSRMTCGSGGVAAFAAALAFPTACQTNEEQTPGTVAETGCHLTWFGSDQSVHFIDVESQSGSASRTSLAGPR